MYVTPITHLASESWLLTCCDLLAVTSSSGALCRQQWWKQTLIYPLGVPSYEKRETSLLFHFTEYFYLTIITVIVFQKCGEMEGKTLTTSASSCSCAQSS